MRRLWPRLALMLTILGLAHAYIWWRFVSAPDLPQPWFTLASIAVFGLTPSLPAATFGLRRVKRARAKQIALVVYTWFACAVYLLLAAALSHLAVAFGVSARAAALGGVGATVATIAYGFLNVARGPVVRRIRVTLDKLPAAARGYTIVHLTDVHIGRTLGSDFAQAVADKVNALDPDLVVLTGDIVDGFVSELAPHVAPLGELRAKDGVYAVTGNHEYYWRVEEWLAHFGSLGFRVLRNSSVRIRDAFTLAGTDDISSRSMAPGHGEDVPAATANRDPALPTILLAHHPRTVASAKTAGVDLQLSGHTHGGQLLPLGWLARLFDPRVAGLARFGATQLYVSEGTGFWGPPLRIGTVCEIAAITLEPAP